MTDTPTPSSAATPAIQPQHLKAFYEYPHPVDVYSVVTGAQNVPQSVLKPDLEYVADAQTVREATERSYKTIHRWMHSGLFKNVNLNFEPLSQEGMSKDEKAQTDRSVVAHFSVDEARMNRIEVGVSTTTTMVPEFNASVHNLYGRPLSLSAVLFPAKSKVPSGEIRLRSQMPYVGRVAEHSFGRRIENRLTSNRPVAIADSEVITELKSCLAFGGFEEMPTYTVTASISDRNLAVKELSSLPPELAAEYKSDTKLALRFTAQRAVGIELSADEKERNRMNLPVRGAFAGVAVEAFAAVDQGPTASPLDRVFVKGEASVGLHKRLCSFLTLDLNALGGAIWSASETARVPLSDRFYLSDKYVRGYRSIGPNTRDFCEERNLLPARVYRALGGNAVWAASASLNFPLSPNASMVCGHLFANAGSVIEDWRAKSVTSLSSLFASPTASIGVGVVATLPAFSSRTCGRLEANLSVPLQWQQQGLRVAWDYNANLFQRFRFGLRWSNVSVGGN